MKAGPSNESSVAIFWDYENCSVPANSSGHVIAKNIRSLTHSFGCVKVFKAYLETSKQTSTLRSELQLSGVTLVDCPHNGKKEVADKMILVDMMAYALDNSPPCTLFLISGDCDFAYALSVLNLRHYQVVLIAGPNTRPILSSQTDICFSWLKDVVKCHTGAPDTHANHKLRQRFDFHSNGISAPPIVVPSLPSIPIVDKDSTINDIDVVPLLRGQVAEQRSDSTSSFPESLTTLIVPPFTPTNVQSSSTTASIQENPSLTLRVVASDPHILATTITDKPAESTVTRPFVAIMQHGHDERQSLGEACASSSIITSMSSPVNRAFSLPQALTTYELNDLSSKYSSFKSNDPGFDVVDKEDHPAVHMTSPKTMGSLELGHEPRIIDPARSHLVSSDVFDSRPFDSVSRNVPCSQVALRLDDSNVQLSRPIQHPTSELQDDIDAPLLPQRPASSLSSHSQQSNFSCIELPTVEVFGSVDTTDAANGESFVIVPLLDLSGSTVNEGLSCSQVTTISTPAPVPFTPFPTTLTFVPPGHMSSLPQPASPPEKWMPLVNYLRKSNGIAMRKKLMNKVLSDCPRATAIAGCDKGNYIGMAIGDGVVERCVGKKSKAKNGIKLKTYWASPPPKWLPVVRTIHDSNGVIKKKRLVREVQKQHDYAMATAIAGCSKGTYIDMAIREGVVENGIMMQSKDVPMIRLTENYAY